MSDCNGLGLHLGCLALLSDDIASVACGYPQQPATDLPDADRPEVI